MFHHNSIRNLPCDRVVSFELAFKPLPIAVPQIPPFHVDPFVKVGPNDDPLNALGCSPLASPDPEPNSPNRFPV